MILDRVEPALALTGKVEVPVPGMSDPRFRAIGQQQQRRGAVERRHAEPVLDRRHVHLPAVAAGGPVIVAVVHEHLEFEREAAACSQHTIADVRRVGALLHPDTLLDERVGDRVGPHRGRPLEGEAFDRPVPVGLDRVPGPAVGEKG